MGMLVLAQLAIAVYSWLTLPRDVGPYPVPTRRWPEALIWAGLAGLLILARGSFGFDSVPPSAAFLVPMASAGLVVWERQWVAQKEEDLIEEIEHLPEEGPVSSPPPDFSDEE